MTISEFLRSSGITTKHYGTLRTSRWYTRVVPLLLAVSNNQTDDKRNRSFGIPFINQTLSDTIPIAIRFRVRWYTHVIARYSDNRGFDLMEVFVAVLSSRYWDLCMHWHTLSVKSTVVSQRNYSMTIPRKT